MLKYDCWRATNESMICANNYAAHRPLNKNNTREQSASQYEQCKIRSCKEQSDGKPECKH